MVKRIEPLDGIRGLAIISVLLFHIAPGGTEFLKGGFLGVDLFFVLSGFLITSILLDEKTRNSKINFLRFYIRRILRLFPALFLLLIAVGIYSEFRLPPELQAKITRGIVSSVFYYSNWILAWEIAALHMLNHTWSLSIEEQFYIVFPWLLLLLIMVLKKEKVLSGTFLLLSFASACVMAYYYAGPDLYYIPYNRTESHLAPILLGVSLALYIESSPTRSFTQLQGIVAFLSVFLFSIYADFRSVYMYYGGFYLYAFAAAVLIGHAATGKESILNKILSISPLTWLGKLSYGIYLWHFPVFVVISVEYPGTQNWPHFIAGIIATLILAILSFYLVESPCLKLKKRFSN